MLLHIKLIIKLDKTDKYKPILIVMDIMEHACMRTSLHFNYLLKVAYMAVGGVNKTQYSCYLYTQNYHKLHKRPRRFPLFSF